MRVLILKIYLIFVMLILISEIFTNFKIFRIVSYSIDSKVYFQQKKIIIDSFETALGSDGVDIGYVAIGHLEGEVKTRKVEILYRDAGKYLKKDNNQNQYCDVWYQKKVDSLVLKKHENYKLTFQSLFKFIFTYILPVFAFLYYRKLSEK